MQYIAHYLITGPQIIVAALVIFFSMRTHAQAISIWERHPKTAARTTSLTHGSFLLALAYVFIQVNWAMSMPEHWVPSTLDLCNVAWDFVVMICLLMWSLTAGETVKDRMKPEERKPCRPCPWRGEGEDHLIAHEHGECPCGGSTDLADK